LNRRRLRDRLRLQWLSRVAVTWPEAGGEDCAARVGNLPLHPARGSVHVNCPKSWYCNLGWNAPFYTSTESAVFHAAEYLLKTKRGMSRKDHDKETMPES
jgi:hypothetical protein